MINNNNTRNWAEDIIRSVDFYNEWFISFAPITFKESRKSVTILVENLLKELNNLENLDNLDVQFLSKNPSCIEILRMFTAPPLASDRLTGLAGLALTDKSFVKNMEKSNRLPKKYDKKELEIKLNNLCEVVIDMLDYELFSWLKENRKPSEKEIYRVSTIIADRLTGVRSNPIIRNEQEHRQINKIESFLISEGYTKSDKKHFDKLENGTYATIMNVPGETRTGKTVKIPVDFLIKRKTASYDELPILIECKSAGDFTNTNKRRKEEANKLENLKRSYKKVEFILFLCGYFDAGYLGYAAADGIDWIWEHRWEDLKKLNI